MQSHFRAQSRSYIRSNKNGLIDLDPKSANGRAFSRCLSTDFGIIYAGTQLPYRPVVSVCADNTTKLVALYDDAFYTVSERNDIGPLDRRLQSCETTTSRMYDYVVP